MFMMHLLFIAEHYIFRYR